MKIVFSQQFQYHLVVTSNMKQIISCLPCSQATHVLSTAFKSNKTKDKTFENYCSKFLYSYLINSCSLPWQNIAWSCSGNLQEVAINTITPHTNLLEILEMKKNNNKLYIMILENNETPSHLDIQHIKANISSFLTTLQLKQIRFHH